MNNHSLFLVFCLLVGEMNCLSQETGYKNQVDRLFDKIPAYCKINPATLPDTSFITACSDILRDYPVRIRYSILGKGISNIGVAVFDMESLGNEKDVLLFTERLILEAIILPDPREIEKRYNELQVTARVKPSLMQNDQMVTQTSVFPFAKAFDNLVINRDSLNYEVILKNNEGGALRFLFPAEIQLITGKDKPELDRDLERILRGYEYDTHNPEFADELAATNAVHPYLKEMFRITGPRYSNLIIPDVFLKKDSDGYYFVFEKDYPKESLSNLLLVPLNIERRLMLEWHIYGETPTSLNMNLRDFVGYFRHQGFCQYIGFEKTEGNSLSCTVIYYNPIYNYLHLISLKTNSKDLYDSEKPLKGKFYSYIPTHNIKNLFRSFESGQKFQILQN